MIQDGSTKDGTWKLILAVVAAAVLVPTGVNAAAEAFKLQDGDGRSKAQVDKGAVRVGDGDGPMTVDDGGGELSVNDGGGALSVDDGGGKLSVTDGDGPMTVDDGGGELTVNDGNGSLTVDGEVSVTGKSSSTDAGMLAYGDCDTQAHTETHAESAVIPAGTVVTEIHLGTDWNSSATSTLLVKKPSVPGFDAGTETGAQQRAGRFLSLQVGWTSGYADYSETLSFGDGVKLDEPWHIYCGGVIGSSQGTALWSVYGYEA